MHTSNHIEEFRNVIFYCVITVCDHARENCPFFPSDAKQIHVSFSDPAKAVGSKDQVLEAFRETRNLIKEFSKKIVENNWEMQGNIID